MEILKERFELSLERICQIPNEQTVPEQYLDYFKKGANFLLLLAEISKQVRDGSLYKKTEKELSEYNHKLYEDILVEAYQTSYTNPEYTVLLFGGRIGKAMSCLMTELRSLITPAFKGQLFELTVGFELFLEIYQYFQTIEDIEELYQEFHNALYYYVHDYMEEFTIQFLKEDFDPKDCFIRDLLIKEDVTDSKILYFYGEYISENEKRMAAFLNSLPEKQLSAMADTYVEGYIRGFSVMGLSFEKKNIVSIRYPIGFERMIQIAIKRLEQIGKEVTIHIRAISLAGRIQGRRGGHSSTTPNPQYDYDHRFDDGLLYDKKLKETAWNARKTALEQFKEKATLFAGPAVVQSFGEPEYTPYLKAQAIQRNVKQQELITKQQRDINILQREYINSEETSYTIIAYPIPSIGKDFEEIFKETVKINTLDNTLYQKIGQCLIDVLDCGEWVTIKGQNGNKTDLTIHLQSISDPERETKFENCTADVNIPVGEVFTSPVLKGTNGLLHVKKVYLMGLYYRDLSLVFKDGMIVSYDCKNFKSKEENKTFLKENLMFGHITLPMGEFAIGTNTTAYAMAQKYQIQDKLPILIAEKTGPHFAIGDTCYKMSEDHKMYNPNGKEMIARENECSALRKTEIEKAYFNCHTDITIPYDEIGEIASVQKDNTKILIIQNGRFVLPEVEVLNEPL